MRSVLPLMLLVISFVGLSGCGGASGENGSDPFPTDTPTDVTADSFKLGYVDEQGIFIEGVIGVSIPAENGIFEISSGGTLGLSVVLLDNDNQPVAGANSISFSSNCASNDLASLTSDSNTVNGEALASYSDDGCGGNTGSRDEIFATAVIGDINVSASVQIDIQAEVLGTITFVSALPESIVLMAAGSPSQSTVSFLALNTRGGVLAGQEVSFSLNTEVGGLRLSSLTGLTNQAGEVSTEVIAGNVPTSVSVTASITVANGELVQTQSDTLTVTTGLANQQSFSLASDILNVEGEGFDGQEAQITARLADTFNNPVPDNTAVAFTAEGGSIEASCLTVNGACTVVWTSANPRPSNHRVTVLATAVGHETLFDSNGNNVFDNADGGAIVEALGVRADSGFRTSQFVETGFVDQSEAWRDDNENGQRDSGERFLDYNSNQQFDEADGLFNGIQCQSETLCGQGTAATLHVRKALVLIMSGSDISIDAFDQNAQLYASNKVNVSPAPTTQAIARGAQAMFTAVLSDSATQLPPAGTEIDVSSDFGEVLSLSASAIPNGNADGAFEINFLLSNNLELLDVAVQARPTIVLTTPNGQVSRLSFLVNLN